MNNLTFDGHDFSNTFVVGNIEQHAANPRAVTIETGADGAAFSGLVLDPLQITATLYLLGGGFDNNSDTTAEEERRAAIRTLASWLNVDSPKQLSIGDDQGLYYLAVPNGQVPLVRYINASSVQVSFLAIDPVAYGEEHTVTVPSGSSVTFTVDGSYPTRPRITASAVRNSTALVWGLRLDGGDFLHVATGSSSSRNVSIDCDARTLTIANSTSLPTLDSDWLEFTPGQHTLAMDYGTGAATVKYVDRWL